MIDTTLGTRPILKAIQLFPVLCLARITSEEYRPFALSVHHVQFEATVHDTNGSKLKEVNSRPELK